jgi:RNA polymerase sigma-70 factor (ECF subfamily)
MTNFGGAPFPTTMWTMVLGAGRAEGDAARTSLEQLVARYWAPVHAYVSALVRHTRDDAEDITQAFFTRLLERRDLEKLDPELGSFRGFLKRAVRNFVIDVMRRDEAHGTPVALVESDAAAQAGPEEVFEREWDSVVCQAAIEELEQRMRLTGAGQCFEVFRAYCLEQDGSGARHRTYREVGERLGLTESTVRQHLERCRAQLREILWSKIREYVDDEAEVRAEFRRLMAG